VCEAFCGVGAIHADGRGGASGCYISRFHRHLDSADADHAADADVVAHTDVDNLSPGPQLVFPHTVPVNVHVLFQDSSPHVQMLPP